MLRKIDKMEADMRELQQGLTSERRMSESHQHQLADHRASIQERCDDLEKLSTEVAQELQTMRGKIEKVAHAQGSTQQQAAQNASMLERLQSLEQGFGDSTGRYEADMFQAKAKFEQLHNRLADHHSKLLLYTHLDERFGSLEKLWGDASGKHAENLAALGAKVELMHGRLASCERHGSLLHEIQRPRLTMPTMQHCWSALSIWKWPLGILRTRILQRSRH